MRRKPKYLDRERRAARTSREFWEGAKWSPTQSKNLFSRAHLESITVNGAVVWSAPANENS